VVASWNPAVRLIRWGGALAARVVGSPFLAVCGDGQKGVGEHREGDVSIPGVVFADLVLVEPDLVLSGAETFLDGPAGAGYVHEFTESGMTRVVTMVVGKFTVVDRFADHVLVVGFRGMTQRPVVYPEAFGSDTAGPALPEGMVQLRRKLVNVHLVPGRVGERGVFRQPP